CTGENIPHDFKALGLDMPESEITLKNILDQNIPKEQTILLNLGTSTKEESEFILKFCHSRKIKTITVLSSKFHTRRIQKTFKKKFENEGITVLLRGAPSNSYDESAWWKSENGLIAVNNEYIKLLYYAVKY